MQQLLRLLGIGQLNSSHKVIFGMCRIVQIEIVLAGVDILILDDDAFAKGDPVF
ncbi:hypothetical protein D3C71_2038950 [compost metagenome]